MYKNVIKRLIDIIISLMLIPFILILIIPVALFIKLEDHGDVFYNAEQRCDKIIKLLEKIYCNK